MPCGTAPMAFSRHNLLMVESLNGRPVTLGNTSPDPSDSSAASSSTRIAALESGISVQPPAFRPRRRHVPGRRVPVNFGPGRKPRLGRSRNRQGQKLETQRSSLVGTAGSDLAEGIAHLLVWQRPVMHCRSAVPRQRRTDALVAGIVDPETLAHGPLEHQPKASAEFACRLGLRLRERRQK